MDYSQFLYMREEVSLLVLIVILFLADLFLHSEKKGDRGTFSALWPVSLLVIHTLINIVPVTTTVQAFGGMYVNTPMTTIMKTILNIGTIIIFLMANEWLKRSENHIKQGEFYLLTLFTLLGMYFMMSSGHFLMFFIGLELASVPLAALITYRKQREESVEAGAKFILLALFSSALMVYGISLLYGSCGTLYFDDMTSHIDGSFLQILSLAFIIAGLGFKLSLVPFHLWTADTYQGAPTVVTGYLSVISKGAAAFTLFTILIKVFAPMMSQWDTALFWLIMASITIGNIFALRQQNLKRFMAFSAISQAGYVLLGIMSGTAEGLTAMVYYLLVYLAANLAIFAAINIIEERSGKEEISDLNGFYHTNPKLSFLITLSLFSLAGIPPFAGFFSKFFIFMSAFKGGHHLLVFIALINTVISLYYYLLIVKAMYINQNNQPITTFRSDNYTRVALVVCTLGVIFLGLASCIFQFIDAHSYGLIG